eukprot:g687.t1
MDRRNKQTTSSSSKFDLSKMLKEIDRLNTEGLYESAEFLASFTVTASKKSKDGSLDLAYELYANALFGLELYGRAVEYYKLALKTNRHASSSSGVGATGGSSRRRSNSAPIRYVPPSGVRKSATKKKSKEKNGASAGHRVVDPAAVRFRIFKCMSRLGDHRAAIVALEKIPASARTAAMSMALARTHRKRGSSKRAIECYRGVLRKNPYALGALVAMQEMGVATSDVEGIVANDHADETWLATYFGAHDAFVRNDLTAAMKGYGVLQTVFASNPHVLAGIAKTHLMRGDMSKAGKTFGRLHAAHRLIVKDMDMYASALHAQRDSVALNRLTHALLEANEARPEPWNSVALYSDLKGDIAKSIEFANQGISLAPRRVFSHVLAGSLQLYRNDASEAEKTFLRASDLNQQSFLALKGLLNVYLTTRNDRRIAASSHDAIRIARRAIKAFPRSAQAHCLMGRALLARGDSASFRTAREHLDRALKMDPGATEAILSMVELHVASNAHEEALALLKSTLSGGASDVAVHVKLADVLAAVGKYTEALHHYHTALSISPNSREAAAGLEELEGIIKADPSNNADSGAEASIQTPPRHRGY